MEKLDIWYGNCAKEWNVDLVDTKIPGYERWLNNNNVGRFDTFDEARVFAINYIRSVGMLVKYNTGEY